MVDFSYLHVHHFSLYPDTLNFTFSDSFLSSYEMNCEILSDTMVTMVRKEDFLFVLKGNAALFYV